MKNQNYSNSTIFQDRNLIDATVAAPRNSKLWLTADDERAESFEGWLRVALVLCLACSVLFCNVLPQGQTASARRDLTVNVPALHLPAQAVQAPVSAVQAMLR